MSDNLFQPHNNWHNPATVSKSTELQIAEGNGTSIQPTGSATQKFQILMEGNMTQAREAVARVSPEELLRSIESKSRSRKMLRGKTSLSSSRNKIADLLGKIRQLKYPGSRSEVSENLSKERNIKQLAEKFLGLIVNAERDLFDIEDHLVRVSTTQEAWNPAQLFLVQVRVSHLSQQIELFTSLLNKALESSKQLFNTQI